MFSIIAALGYPPATLLDSADEGIHVICKENKNDLAVANMLAVQEPD
ncbi:hypothetical protein EBBID32_42020 [Sphingobium indicum BiD32]|uniref:Uncharacterized protein n=1 Tax=Sphingobium indicum BiD32 TaxID=1301087 RepID=N1MW89_9SPHN|nr:hypothetical protein EBBID32_42020 [Sphingobium indicum BiD32]